MALSLRQIEVFHAVMLSGGATQAAALLRTSQPTVSRDLKDLERSLGFPLFIRSGRHLLPTEAALALHAEVRRSFIGMEEIMRAAEAIRVTAAAQINIACLPAYSSALLPQVCRDFLASHPAVRLNIHSFEQAVIAKGLTAQQYDIGIIEVDPRLEGMAAVAVNVGEELCILPKGHPLARKDILTPGDFEGVDFIDFSMEDSYRRIIDNVFLEHGVVRSLRIGATTATAVCSLVAQGLGVSIINPLSALFHRGMNLELRRFSVPAPYTVGLYRPDHRLHSDLGAQFLDCCASALNAIAREAQMLA